MKKRIWSALMALCLCVSLLPTAAWAETESDYGLTVGGVAVTSSNAANITADITNNGKISAEGEGGGEGEGNGEGEGHSHYNCGVKGCTNAKHGHSQVAEWTKLTQANVQGDTWELTSGSYYLGGDITVTNRVEISGTVNLCLNGCSLTSAYEDGTIIIKNNSTLNVTDCGSGGKIANTGSGNAIVTSTFGEEITLNLYKGTLESGAASAYYNGDAYANCIFNQYGGKVTSAATDTVSVMDGCGQYNLYGGSVENTNQNGRSVYVGGDSTQLSISGTVQLNQFIWVTNPIVIAGAITEPANAYIIKYQPASGGSTGTFTSGWNTYMASADETKYFAANNQNYTITKDNNGELQITRNGQTQPPSSYSVTFDAGGGSGTMNAVSGVSGSYQLPACAFTAPAGKRFKAWKVGGTEYAAGASITVSANTTVTAVWEAITYTLSGEITGTGASGVAAKLIGLDGAEYTATVTGENSPYHYEVSAPKGGYQLLVTAMVDGETVTVTVKVELTADVEQSITLPDGMKNSVVDRTSAGQYENALVGGLDAIAAGTTIGNGQTLEIKLAVAEQAANESDIEQTAIKEEASDRTLEFVALTLTKKIDSGTPENIGGANDQMLTIEFPFETEGKENFAVYRYHGSGVDTLTTTANGDGEKIVVGDGSITIYAKKFSTYAIGYTATGSGSGTPGGQQPARPNRSPSSGTSYVHACVSKCQICGGCTDEKCSDKACAVKCKLVSMSFEDVTKALWCYDAVEFVYHYGLMQGYGEDEFYPDGNVTRQQVWMVLARMSGADPKSMAAARVWAMENGVSDGSNPTAYITRQQLATMLWRYAKLQGKDVSVGENTNILSYTDAFNIAEYAIPAMQWACGEGIIGGYNDGSVKPMGNASRGHMAAFLQRFCEAVK